MTDAEYIPQRQVPRWITDKAYWDQFTEITEQIAGIPDSEPLEFYGQIIGKITEGATKSIPKSDGYYKVAPVPWWNANCANLKKERLKAQKQANRHPMVSNKIKYKRLRAMFQRAQKDSQNSSWKKYVSTLISSTENAKVWKKVGKIKGKYQPEPPPTLKVNGTTLIKPKDVATALAEHYASSSLKTKNLHHTVHNRAQIKRIRAPFSMRGGHPDNALLNAPFTLKEMESQLDQCKDSAPGPDDITISMIKNLTTPAKHTLLRGNLPAFAEGLQLRIFCAGGGSPTGKCTECYPFCDCH